MKQNVFDPMIHLTELRISNNKIVELDERLFIHLGKLTQLNLDNNSITSMKQNVFDPWIHLTELRISNNKIVELDERLFGNLHFWIRQYQTVSNCISLKYFL